MSGGVGYTEKARDSASLSSANDGKVTCPAPVGAGYHTLPPCRVLDTRGAPSGPLAGPALQPSAIRTFDVPAAALTSTIDFTPGRTLANNAVIALVSGMEQPGQSQVARRLGPGGLRDGSRSGVRRRDASRSRPGRRLRVRLFADRPLARRFARIRCPDCAAEYLLAFSCNGRGLCPSCGATRAAEFAAFLKDEAVADVGRALEALARYCMRSPVSLTRLRWTPGADTASCLPRSPWAGGLGGSSPDQEDQARQNRSSSSTRSPSRICPSAHPAEPGSRLRETSPSSPAPPPFAPRTWPESCRTRSSRPAPTADPTPRRAPPRLPLSPKGSGPSGPRSRFRVSGMAWRLRSRDA